MQSSRVVMRRRDGSIRVLFAPSGSCVGCAWRDCACVGGCATERVWLWVTTHVALGGRCWVCYTGLCHVALCVQCATYGGRGGSLAPPRDCAGPCCRDVSGVVHLGRWSRAHRGDTTRRETQRPDGAPGAIPSALSGAVPSALSGAVRCLFLDFCVCGLIFCAKSFFGTTRI